MAGGPARARRGRWRRRAAKWRACRAMMARFAPFARKRRAALGVALACTVAYMLVRLAEPWPLKLILDNVLLERPPPAILAALGRWTDDRLALLAFLTAMIVAVAVLGGLFYYLQRLQAARIGQEVTAELRLALYSHIQGLSFSFHDRRRTGDLIVRLTSDIQMLRRAFISLPARLTEEVLLLAGMALIMLVMDWQLALLALMLLPLVATLVRRYQRPMRAAVRQQREREGHLATMAAEALGAIKVVQGFRRERDEVRKFGSANRRSMRSGLKAARLEAKLKWSADLAVGVVTAIVVGFAAHRILTGALSPGDLIVFVAYLRIFARPLRQVSRVTEQVARVTAAGERVLEILNTEPTVRDLPGAVPAPRLRGAIAFERVSFAYGRRPALVGIDLTIAPGERVALVGPTGAGKSTIASLVPRFYDVTEGRVCIDGRDVREYTLASLRKQISIVFQEPVLFASSIAENIAYGKPEATIDDVVKAARRAGIDHHICRLRDGYDTVIGERGARLSGGQRQCVAIARAIIRNAPIVILDELTVGLDDDSAKLVMKALDRLMRGRTVLMISHDMSNVAFADRVVSVDDGRIVGERSAGEAVAAALPRSKLREVPGG